MNKKYYKRLGQNFLQDEFVIKKIISFINPKFNDCLIEIGPGFGALTYPISFYVKKLNAIEIDKKLFIFLKKKFLHKKVFLFNKDVMKFDFFNLIKNKNKKIRIFGNLPYSISTQLIFYLIKYNHYISDMYFMFQKEVANRLIAKPGNKSYGRLSIISQYFYDIKILYTVEAKSFKPKPKVDSIFLQFLPKKIFIYNIKISTLDIILKKSFEKRRKTLKNNLKNFISCETLDDLSINYKLRAEKISKEQFYKLAFFYEKNKV